MGDDPNRAGNSRRWIVAEVENSLRRLQTDHLDLYQIHRPDPAVDVEETLSALTDLIRSGKVRAVGSSTFPASDIVEAQWVAERRGLERFRTEQPPYSIVNRGIEREVLPVCRRYGMGTLVWSPLAMGLLTGRYRKGQETDSARMKFAPGRLTNERKLDVVEQLIPLAEQAGIPMTHLAMAFAIAHPGVTSAIIGPRTMDQLDDVLAGAEVTLDDEVLDRIDEIVPRVPTSIRETSPTSRRASVKRTSDVGRSTHALRRERYHLAIFRPIVGAPPPRDDDHVRRTGRGPTVGHRGNRRHRRRGAAGGGRSRRAGRRPTAPASPSARRAVRPGVRTSRRRDGRPQGGEQELKERKERHDQLELRALDPGERDRFQADWLAIQRGFVDDPGGSVEHADALVVTIMRTRGYPVEDGRQRADDLSVAHPDVVEHYREARRIASANRDGQASTEDLRSAVTAFRSLVDALLAGGQDAGGQDAGGGGGRRDASGGRGPGGDDAPAGGPGGSTQRLGNPEASTQQLGADRGGNDDGRRR